MFHKLSKKISRKNLYRYIDIYIDKIQKEKNGLDNIKVLNIGSGGEIQNYLKKKFKQVYNIDIDKRRNPDQVIDICKIEQLKKLSFKPNLVCMFEVLEHTKDPVVAIKNLHNIIDEKTFVMFSSPFIFHIHDEPEDYFRFTKYGLKNIFKDFDKVEINSRNGWFETILVLFVRLRMDKSILNKLLGNFFILIYFLFIPITFLIQKIFKSDKITTGYFLFAKK